MSRITNTQKAGLDFLDQVFFHELVVYKGMDATEQQQLDTISSRVTQMVKSKYSGHEAEIVKHLAYCYLELSLINPYTDWIKAAKNLNVELPPTLSDETTEAVGSAKLKFMMGLMLALTEISTGFDAHYAIDIFEALKDEFTGYSPLVRGNLAHRCFSYEFNDSSLATYCWLVGAGVLPVQKNGLGRVKDNFITEFMTRLALLANFEAVKNTKHHNLHSNYASIATYLDAKFTLNDKTIDRVLNVKQCLESSLYQLNLDGIPFLDIRNIAEAPNTQQYFEQWGRRSTRYRMHSGTLASWLGVLGAGMVEYQRVRAYNYAAQEEFNKGASYVTITDLKIPAIFKSDGKKDTISEFVRDRLLTYGLHINSETLYRCYTRLDKKTIPVLNLYCKITRDVGIVMNTDTVYNSVFVIADGMKKTQGTTDEPKAKPHIH